MQRLQMLSLQVLLPANCWEDSVTAKEYPVILKSNKFRFRQLKSRSKRSGFIAFACLKNYECSVVVLCSSIYTTVFPLFLAIHAFSLKDSRHITGTMISVRNVAKLKP